MLALAGFVTREQCHANSIAGKQARNDISERCTQLRRWSIRIACEIHHSRLALRDNVVAGPVAVRAGVAEAGNRTINGARIHLGNSLIAEAKLVENAGPEVLDDDIRPLDELPQNALSVFGLEIESQTFLVSIDRHKVSAD